MAKVTANDVIQFLRGSVGNLTFKLINGQLHATRRARSKKKKRPFRGGTPKQNEWRKNFCLATRFASDVVKKDPALLAFYTLLAKKHGMRLRDICLSDYFSLPVIEGVDLSRYTGQPGSTITFRAFEKYPLATVKVALRSGNATPDEGLAKSRGRTWRYTATGAMPPGKVNVQIVAMDHTGQRAVYHGEWEPEA